MKISIVVVSHSCIILLGVVQASFIAGPSLSSVVSFKTSSSSSSLSSLASSSRHHLCQQQRLDDDDNVGVNNVSLNIKQQLSRNDNNRNNWKHFTSSLAVAGTIACAAWGSGSVSFGETSSSSFSFPTPPVTNAVELSSGAFSIQVTTGESGQSLSTASVDTRKLLTTLLQNRKQLTASVERILVAVQQELQQQPVWKELQKEVLLLEGDVVPSIQVLPPQNWQQLVRDLSQGKLNFIVNGEIINLEIDETFSKQQDEIVVRIQGFKGVDLSLIETAKEEETIAGSITEIYARRWQQRLDSLQKLWDMPLGLVEMGGTTTSVTAGPVVAGGLGLTIATAYGGSYAYYANEQAKAAADAEAKQKAAEAKKAAAAAKAKQKQQEE